MSEVVKDWRNRLASIVKEMDEILEET